MDRRTRRIEFDGGDWWEVYQELSQGTYRAVEQVTRRMLRLDGARVDAATGALSGGIALDPERWDAEAANEVLLLGSTPRWSYGDVTREVYDTVPRRHVEDVLAYVNEVYKRQDPLAVGRSADEPQRTSSPR